MSVGADHRVSVVLSLVCSNACVFCAVASSAPAEASTEPASSLDEASALLTRARADGATELTFVGGEPTHHPRLLELVALARGIGFQRIGIQTHARDLGER
ncbi:MAG: radical SAM protein, partial [Deltaproteobacteria bacterium]